LLSRSTTCRQSSKSCAFWPTSGKRSKNGTMRSRVVGEAIHLPVPAAVAGDPHRAAAVSLAEEIERSPIDLRDVEGGREPEAFGAAAAFAADNHEASLSQREPGQESTECDVNRLDGRPFLLIACTRHIVTVAAPPDGTSSAGCSGVPAYSRLLQLPRSTDSYGRRLPGLSFGASGQALTPPRNLPAPGRRQPLYVVLRLSRDLCFW
jgi:hypothetical protein